MLMGESGSSRLTREFNGYWNGRAQSYSNGVVGELSDTRKDAWKADLQAATDDVLAQALSEGRTPRACDLGCGPGFFSIVLTEIGFQVDGVDASESMLAHARENIAEALPDAIVDLHASNVISLPFPDGTFDLCACRNITWLMQDPHGAYAEWLRVLRPGGKLLVYDANWYRYLVDEEVAAARAADQKDRVLEGCNENAQATSDEEKRCEELERDLPLTPVLRPAWDLETLKELGVANCRADEDAWLRVWPESEQLYYGSTPMFMIEAVK